MLDLLKNMKGNTHYKLEEFQKRIIVRTENKIHNILHCAIHTILYVYMEYNNITFRHLNS